MSALIKSNCLCCNKEILEYPSRREDGRGKFCSKQCFDIKRKEDEYGRSTREKLKNYFTGRPNYKARRRVICNCDFCGKEIEKEKNCFEKRNRHYCNKECRNNHFRTFRGKNAIAFANAPRDLYELIRQSPELIKWRQDIFKRDDYTCQSCKDKRGGNLEAHHKKRFHSLFKEFLSEYNQFSPIEDKHTLVRIAINYKPFYDLENGITLCEDCHKLTDNYGKMGLKKSGN